MISLASYTSNNGVGIQSIFPREDTDFTPWLAKNLKRLARPLGMKLRPIDHETRVPFGRSEKRVDILAEEPNLDSPVVIENQYGQSEDIALSLKCEPQWGSSEYRSFRRVSVSRDGCILGSRDELAEIRSWMKETLLNFRAVFGTYIEFAQADLV